jgi:hypothetical protein
MTVAVPSEAYSCSDEGFVSTPAADCYALLRRIREYGRWWRLVAIEPVRCADLLEVGDEFDFVGRNPRGEVRWRCAVRALLPPGGSRRGGGDVGVRIGRIDLEYVSGDLVGPTGWEIEPVPERSGTLVRYVYHGVRAMSAGSARSLSLCGTRLHSHAMRVDAFAGIARWFGGPGAELADDVWDARVRAAMSEFDARANPPRQPEA